MMSLTRSPIECNGSALRVSDAQLPLLHYILQWFCEEVSRLLVRELVLHVYDATCRLLTYPLMSYGDMLQSL